MIRKTRDMEWAEGKLGGPLEEKLPELYERFNTHEAVAEHIGINRVTLVGWLETLGAERTHQLHHVTRVRFPHYTTAR